MALQELPPFVYTEMALLDHVGEDLRKNKVKLWEPPYVPDIDGSLAKLASTISGRASFAATAEDVLEKLQELQQHALTKLRGKTQIILVGRVVGAASCSNMPHGNGEMRVECSAEDRGATILTSVCERLGTSRLKIIAGGLPLQEESTLQEQEWKTNKDRGMKTIRVVFLASGKPTRQDAQVAEPVEMLTASVSSSEVTIDVEGQVTKKRTTVAQVRDAAEVLTREGFGDFELYDGKTGKIQDVEDSARQALVTAIALHSRGRELLTGVCDRCCGRIERFLDEVVAVQNNSALAEALEFLAEADRCFERCKKQGAASLVNQLENYGQLQLDICWAYALLGDSSCLTDAISRLTVAEHMLLRQVDRNFLTLAGVQADQGRVLPPEVIPSVRLWLLRGIAFKVNGDPRAQDDLERAGLFMQGLRVSEDAVSSLCNVGATRAQAIAALRRNGGDPNRAAEALMTAIDQKKRQRKDRDSQRQFGKTDGGVYIDPVHVEKLVSMGIQERDAVEGLKQYNNDFDAALDDLASKELGLRGGTSVDELALAQLLSMGFERANIEVALRTTGNNVEEALIVLTSEQFQTDASIEENRLADSSTNLSESHAGAETRVLKTENRAEDAGDTTCAIHGCMRASWNGKQGEACCRTCTRSGGSKHGADCNRKWRLAHPEFPLAEKDEARAIVEEALGQCLRKTDLDDMFAGAELHVEEFFLRKYLS